MVCFYGATPPDSPYSLKVMVPRPGEKSAESAAFASLNTLILETLGSTKKPVTSLI